jgi:alanine dehydrogenase
LIVTDSLEQAQQEAGDLILAFDGSEARWAAVKLLADVADGKTGRASNGQVTLFKSNGIASWDLAAAMVIFSAAREKQLGRELPLWTESAKSAVSQ